MTLPEELPGKASCPAGVLDPWVEGMGGFPSTKVLVTACLVPMVLVALAAPAVAPHVCDPYPIGRCGDYQRESVVFCYVLVQGQYVSATETDVIAIGSTPGANPPNVVGVGDAPGLFFVLLTPTMNLAADPWEAPMPFKSLWRERNAVQGLQIVPFQCANFVWFAECEPAAWMGPFNITDRVPDEFML